MPHFITPNSFGTLRESNDCHTPAGSSEGGQFCSKQPAGFRKPPGLGRMSNPQSLDSQYKIKQERIRRHRERIRERRNQYKSPGERAAANGEIHEATPAAFKAALAKNSRADTLSDYDEATLSTFKLYLLKGGQAGYAIKRDGEFINLFNNGPKEQTGGAGPWLVIHAIERGATHGDHFDGFLTGFYKKLGWTETKREKNWTPGGPDVVYMEFKGDRHTARQRYRRHGHLEP